MIVHLLFVLIIQNLDVLCVLYPQSLPIILAIVTSGLASDGKALGGAVPKL